MKAPEWLSHLRTDKRGRPVPVINRWGLKEKPELARVEYCWLVGGKAAFYDDSDETEPDFKTQNIGRQRSIVLWGNCQVCGRHVPWSRRFLVLSSVTVQRVTSPGPRRGAITVQEPWLDQRCAEFATKYCPALIRRSDDEDLTLISVTSKTDCEILIGTGSIDGFPETRTEPVAQWASILVKQSALAGAR